MKLVKMRCHSCNSNLDIDMENLIAYCPYCGQKLLIDIENLVQILEARETTKQTLFKEETKRYLDDNKTKQTIIMSGLAVILIIFEFLTLIILAG